MTDDISIGNIVAKAGTRIRERILIGENPDGTALSVPMTIVNGAEAGPKVCLTAAVHGNELEGIEIVGRITSMLHPEKLRGTIIGISVANPVAFNMRERLSVIEDDHYNLNRIFPGSPTGSLSERLASMIFREVVSRSDFLVDYHGGGRDSIARYLWSGGTHAGEETKEKMENMSLSFGQGIPVYVGSYNTPGALQNLTSEKGIPAVTVELGGENRISEEFVNVGVRGTLGILSHIGILSRTEDPKGEQIVVTETVKVHVNRGGIFHSTTGLGGTVLKGDVMGFVKSMYGERIEEIKAPLDGVVLLQRRNPIVYSGDSVFRVGVPR